MLGRQMAAGNEKDGLGEYAIRFIAPDHHLAALEVKRVFNGEDENDGHVAEVVQATNLMGRFPLATYTLPDEVRTFIAKPPTALTYSPSQPAAVKAAAIGEGVGEEKQTQIAAGQVAETRSNLLKTLIRRANGLGVLNFEGEHGRVRLTDAVAASGTERASWGKQVVLLNAMMADGELQKWIKALADGAEVAQMSAATAPAESQLSAEEKRRRGAARIGTNTDSRREVKAGAIRIAA